MVYPLWSVTLYRVKLAPLPPLLFQCPNIYGAPSECKALCQVEEIRCMGHTWSWEPSYDMSTESCSATWWTWHWSDMDVSGWVLNVTKEINSLWGNKVGGFRLSWVFIIAWRKKEVRTGSGGCELRCWAIFLPTARGEGGNGWAQSEWKGGLKETSFPLCCSPSQLLSFLVIGLTAELGCLHMGHLPWELTSHWRASPCSPVKDPASWVRVGNGETVAGRELRGHSSQVTIFDFWNHTSTEEFIGGGFLSQGSFLLLLFIFLLPQISIHSMFHLCGYLRTTGQFAFYLRFLWVWH